MQALNRLGELNKIILTWVPGHQGNEIADELVKLGTQEDPVSRVVGVSTETPMESHQKLGGTGALELLKGRTVAGPKS